MSPAPPAPATEQDEASLGFMLKVGGPIIISTISYTLMQFVDRLMVAAYSAEALAAILPATMVGFVSSSFLLGVLTTVNAYISQSFGRRAYRDCAHYCWQAMYLGLLLTVLTTAILWPTAPALFHFIKQPQAIVPLEVTYLRITLLGQFVVASIWATNQFFLGIHRTYVCMVTAMISQVANIVCNYALIFGKWGLPEMGIAGAAWGTVIGAVVNAVIRWFFFFGPGLNRTFETRNSWSLDLHKVRDLLKVGAPAGFAFTVNTAVIGVILFMLIGTFGTDALAATSAVYSCMTLSFMPVIGMSTALTSAVGKSIGRARKDQAEHQTRLCLRLSVLYMGGVGILFFLFRGSIIHIWQLNDTASALGTRLLICAAVFQVFDAAVLIYNGALWGAGDTVWQGIITTLGAFLVLGLGGWAIVTWLPQWGAMGPWIAYTCHVVTVGLANRWRFKSNRWRQIDLFKRGSRAYP